MRAEGVKTLDFTAGCGHGCGVGLWSCSAFVAANQHSWLGRLTSTSMMARVGMGAIAMVLGVAAGVQGASFQEEYGPSSGCGQPPPYEPSSPRQSAYFQDTFDGLQRGYLMHLPTTYDQDRPTPLVISFHGWSMSSQSNWEWMGFKENIEQENYITIFPDGIRDCLGQSQCWSSWNAVEIGRAHV